MFVVATMTVADDDHYFQVLPGGFQTFEDAKECVLDLIKQDEDNMNEEEALYTFDVSDFKGGEWELDAYFNGDIVGSTNYKIQEVRA